MRERCYECFRPVSQCFCELIPRIDNLTHVLLLQHVGERFHPFNTARMVRKALRRSVLVTDHNRRIGTRQLPIRSNSALLFPQPGAPLLADLPIQDRPEQLVIIDGTWHQAKTVFRDVPQLHRLSCYRLRPPSPGTYRIRREPNAQSLSTVEATVAALRILEPDTMGLDQLLSAFDAMVEGQLQQAGGHGAWRRKSRSLRPRYVPRSLLQSPERLVVAYGEVSPRCDEHNSQPRSLVSWVARRFGTGECLACHLQQPRPIPETALHRFGVARQELSRAVTISEFRRQWNQFLRPHDLLVVYHPRTFAMLQNIQMTQPRCLVLKSVFRNWRPNCRSLEELVLAEGVEVAQPNGMSRAQWRVELASALVNHLRQQYPST